MQKQLIDEYNILQEHRSWAERGIEDRDVSQLKLILQEARDFLDRWQGKSGEPQIEQKLIELRENNRRVAAVLQGWFLETLYDLIGKRIDWLVQEERFRFSVEFIQVTVNAPSDLRPELEDVFQESAGRDFDPERLYRESEAAAECTEKEFKKALATLEVDWPERVNERLHRRLSATDLRQLESWMNGIKEHATHLGRI